MKLCVLGGGGSRAIILIKSLLQQAKALGITEIVLMDKNADGLGTFGKMAEKAASIIEPDIRVSCTQDAVSAIKGANFVITTIREGGDFGRVSNERLALKYGILGQETTGAGGFAMAMKTIPALAEYCSLIKEHANEKVLVFNFSNPAGLVTQAMRDLGYDFVYGVCDAPSGFLRQVANMRGGSIEGFTMDVFGLNHLSYFTAIKEKGRDITEALIEDPKLYQETDMRYFEPDLAKKWRMLLNEYLYYFYYREKAVENILKGGTTRGEQILSINEEMQEALKSLKVDDHFDEMLELYAKYNHKREISYMATESKIQRNEEAAPKFNLFSPEEGGYAGVALGYIRSQMTGKDTEMILCVPNNGTVDWLEQEDVVEVTCHIGPGGAVPKKGMRGLPDSAKMLIKNVKLYERMAAKAILEKDASLAVEALMIHPLVNSYSIAKSLVGDYIAHNDPLGGWK